jgi:capsid protein
MRVILNTFYRQLEIDQELLIHQVLQPVWQRWLDTAWLAGALKLPGYRKNPQRYQRCEWRAHAWSYVNPLQEAQTAILKIQHGLTSRSAAVAESGWDVEDIDRQQADDHAREQTLGLTYGSSNAPLADEPETVEQPT